MRSRRWFPSTVIGLLAVGLCRGVAEGQNSGGITLIQTEYSSPLDGNVVMIIFDETTSIGVAVLVDGVSIGEFFEQEGAISAPFLDAGEHTFRVETVDPGDPSFSETTFVVLDAQPFGDPTGLVCQDAGPSGEGTCKVELRWTAPAVLPDIFWVLQDAAIVDRDLAGTDTSAALEGVTAGDHLFGLRGLRQANPANPRTFYAGAVVETTCSVSCQGAVCGPPRDIMLCQSGYGAGASAVRVEMLPGGDYPGGIDILRGDSVIKNVPVAAGGRTVDVVASFEPGPLTLSFRGACENGRDTPAVDAAITLLDESPLPDPVAGEVSCSFQPGEGTTATWTNAFPALFIDVHVVKASGAIRVATVPGGTESIRTDLAAPGEAVAIQAFAMVDGVCRGSRLASCSQAAGQRFLRGLCDGNGSFPTISSGVFALNYLFLGGTEPPCIEACDTDGDARLDISDAVLLLNFLFLGGPPPAGWGSDGGVPVPVCETGTAESCATSHAGCP